ncbi:MAG: uroporphyrinogen-III C-methyltransferase [Legionella longbeachae]|nr:uroporphyrinogen-III C-methyltransferase [Legionella longbeachae]
MASNNEKPVKEKPVSKIAQDESSITQNNSICKIKWMIPAVTIIIALGALCTASYTLFLNKQLLNQLDHENNNFSAQLQQLEHKLDNDQEQFHTKINNTQEIQTQLQSKFEHLSKQVQNAMSQRLYQNQDWLLLKVRYYLELAQINVHWTNDFDSAIALLQQADHLLTQLNDVKILDIRQALAKDIAQLQTMPTLDIAGVLSELDAVQTSINDINIPFPINNSESATEKSSTSKSTPSAWRLRLHDSVNLLEKLVVIRRNEKDIKPLMSPILETLFKEKINMNLQEAQWAVLNKNPFVYQLSLKQAIKNLKLNFNENTQNTEALIKKLTELQKIQLTEKKPNIDSALPMLNDLIDAKKLLENQKNNDGQGGNQ